MFSYHPRLPIHVHDNLVSDGQDSLPTMHSGAGVGTREEKRSSCSLRYYGLSSPDLRFDGNDDPL
jgi:hypothetical protein